MERDFFDRQRISTERDLKEMLNWRENQERLAYLLEPMDSFLRAQLSLKTFQVSPIKKPIMWRSVRFLLPRKKKKSQSNS